MVVLGSRTIIVNVSCSLTNQLRDALVFDYGSTLLAREDVWVQGIEYMEQATDGRTALELCLSRVDLKDATVAEEVIRQCQLRNYPAVESEVCKVMSRKALNDNLLGDALVWAIKSQNNLFVAAVADIFLNVRIFKMEFKSSSLMRYCFFRSSVKKAECPVLRYWRISARRCSSLLDWCSSLNSSTSISTMKERSFHRQQSCW